MVNFQNSIDTIKPLLLRLPKHFVIPAKAGIYFFQGMLDAGSSPA